MKDFLNDQTLEWCLITSLLCFDFFVSVSFVKTNVAALGSITGSESTVIALRLVVARFGLLFAKGSGCGSSYSCSCLDLCLIVSPCFGREAAPHHRLDS